MATLPREEAPATGAVSSVDWGGRATRAEIDLDTLSSNVRAVRSAAGDRPLLAVVKADGYGHGAEMVARTVLAQGASWLGVYTVEEGTQLRRSRIEAPILVFGPFRPPEAQVIVSRGLTPTVNSVEAAEWLAAARPPSPLPYHMKIDTGLTRAGVKPGDAVALARRLSEFHDLKAQGLYTHFARADEPERDETAEQLRVFLDAARALTDAGFDFPLRHAANSAATLRMPQAHLDMVRSGISLYGYDPASHAPPVTQLRPVLGLHSWIARVHDVPAGTGVGYGHQFKCGSKTRIGLVPAGYADGLSRSLGCGVGRVIVRGKLVSIVGRVSMDQVTVDLSSVPGAKAGDNVTIIGTQGKSTLTADDVARAIGTISYEVLAGIMPRVPRLYIQGGEVIGVRGLTAQA